MLSNRLKHISDSAVMDIRLAARSVYHAPLFALTIIATVGLGLGLLTAVFTVYNAMFLQPNAIQQPGHLVAVRRPVAPGAKAWLPFSLAEAEILDRDNPSLAGVLATIDDVEVRVDGQRSRLDLVTWNYFDVLGVRPAFGRTLTDADAPRSAPRPVVVLSHKGWGKLFAHAPDVIGRRVTVAGRPYEVVGVMPERFRGLRPVPPDGWAPIGLSSSLRGTTPKPHESIRVDTVVGRLRSGRSPQAAADELSAWAVGRSSLKTLRGRQVPFTMSAAVGAAAPSRRFAWSLFLPLFGASVLILGVACTNVANLIMARETARRRDVALRLSLGAGRWHVVRRGLAECLVLLLGSGLVGLLCSAAAIEAGQQFLVGTLPAVAGEQVELLALGPDWRVGLFLALSCLMVGLAIGLIPALRARRVDAHEELRAGAARPSRVTGGRQAFMVAQVSTAVLLLIGAATFLRGASSAAAADPGLRTDDTVVLRPAGELPRSPLIETLAQHPLVAAIAASAPGPLGPFDAAKVERITRTNEDTMDGAAPDDLLGDVVPYQLVSQRYLSVLGIDLLAGRHFGPDELSPDGGVVILSSRLARHFWPDGPGIGGQVRLRAGSPGAPDESHPGMVADGVFRVIGIARDVGTPGDPLAFRGADVYLPISLERAATALTLQVRDDPAASSEAILADLGRPFPQAGPVQVLGTIAARPVYLLTGAFWVTVVLAAVAITLAMAGLFALLAAWVEQRRHEIGVRMALGATPTDVARLVSRVVIRPVGMGLLLAWFLATVAADSIVASPIGAELGRIVQLTDPLAYAGASIAVLTACVLVTLAPALRAARVDPIEILRRA